MKRNILLLIVCLALVCLAAPVFGSGQSGGSASGGNSSAGGQVANMNLTGYPIAVQPVNLSVAVNKRPQHNRSVAEFEYMIDLEKKTNVKVQWIEWEAAQVDEKRQLAFATNMLPDVFLTSVGSMVNYYGKQGQLAPLNNLIKNYAPDIWNAIQAQPNVIGMMTNPDNGNWYSMAQIRDPMYVVLSDPDLFINKKWLDNLGLKVPETITEFYNALKEFKAKDANGNGNPNDEIPFAFCYQEGSPQYSYTGFYIMFFPFGVAENNLHLMPVNGKLQHTFTMPQFRDGVRLYADMYKDGLIDPESFTYNRQQLFAACKAKEVGAAIGYAPDITFGSDKVSNYVTLYLKGPNGQNPAYYRNSEFGGPGTGPSISASCKTPEIAIRWLNEFYKPELSAQQMYGVLGKYLVPSKDPQYTYQVADPPAGMTYDEYRFTVSNGLGLDFYMPKNLVPNTAVAKKESDAAKSGYFIKDGLPNFVFNDAEMNEIQPMQTELNTFAMTTLANWIVKGTVDSEWDQVQQQLSRMKLPRYLEIYQQVYDRMKAAQ
ncbi:MAG: extracellular solute-binding protein [Treponema sp.]|nr:extracellular solute-binding protein [Treponema sp.]